MKRLIIGMGLVFLPPYPLKALAEFPGFPQTFNKPKMVFLKKGVPGQKHFYPGSLLFEKNKISMGLNRDNGGQGRGIGVETRGIEVETQGIASLLWGTVGWGYKIGGTIPGGVDCSGLVYWFLNQLRPGFKRLSSNQLFQAKLGKKVKKGEERPGDILFFSKNPHDRRVTHLGICIKREPVLMVHAPGVGKKVRVTTPLEMENYWKIRLIEVRRFLL